MNEIAELQRMLDIAGVKYAVAYEVIGIQSPYHFNAMVQSGRKQLIVQKIVSLTQALKCALQDGIDPSLFKTRDSAKRELIALWQKYRK